MLVSGSTQSLPHRSGVVGAQPFVHAKDAADGWQYGAAGGHATPHPPHVAAFERSVSHPSVAMTLQSANPGSHVATMHAPALQFAAACGRLHGVHVAFPHPYIGSESATHEAPHLCHCAGHAPASSGGIGGGGGGGVPVSVDVGDVGGGVELPVSLGVGSVPPSSSTIVAGLLERMLLQPTTTPARSPAAATARNFEFTAISLGW